MDHVSWEARVNDETGWEMDNEEVIGEIKCRLAKLMYSILLYFYQLYYTLL